MFNLGLFHWPWFTLWHCAVYRSWYVAVPFGMCLTVSSCLKHEATNRSKWCFISFFLQRYAVEGKNCLHRASTGVETQKPCSTHTIMRSTKEWETPGSARKKLALILLEWRIWWAANNASRWQMGFNSAFKGLSDCFCFKSVGQRLLRLVWRVSAVRPGKWTPTKRPKLLR